MSERQAKARRKAATKPKDTAPPAPTPPEEGPPPVHHPGVAVLRIPVEGKPGSEQIQIMPLNNIDLLSVPTLLRKAAKMQEDQLDL